MYKTNFINLQNFGRPCGCLNYFLLKFFSRVADFASPPRRVGLQIETLLYKNKKYLLFITLKADKINFFDSYQ